MRKTTVYLPGDMKRALRRAARERGHSQADLVHEGIGLVVGMNRSSKPRLPLFAPGQPDLVERSDQLLGGFDADA
jgi:hypothetical protein